MLAKMTRDQKKEEEKLKAGISLQWHPSSSHLSHKIENLMLVFHPRKGMKWVIKRDEDLLVSWSTTRSQVKGHERQDEQERLK